MISLYDAGRTCTTTTCTTKHEVLQRCFLITPGMHFVYIERDNSFYSADNYLLLTIAFDWEE